MLIVFILANIGNNPKGLSLYDIILTYTLSLILMVISPYLIYIPVLFEPEIYKYILTVIRDSIIPIIRLDSDSESSSQYSNVSPGSVIIVSEAERLARSLGKIEHKMYLCDCSIISLNNSVISGNYLFGRYNILQKVVLHIPSKGLALFDVFSEASLKEKEDLKANRYKLASARAKFEQLRNERLAVLEQIYAAAPSDSD